MLTDFPLEILQTPVAILEQALARSRDDQWQSSRDEIGAKFGHGQRILRNSRNRRSEIRTSTKGRQGGRFPEVFVVHTEQKFLPVYKEALGRFLFHPADPRGLP